MKRGTVIFSRLLRRLSSQDGAALVTCIAMGAGMVTAGASALVYATQNYGDAKRSDAGTRAFALAEAGINNAYSTLYSAANPTLPTAVPETTQTVGDGTVRWSGTYDAGAKKWTLTGIGSVHSPVHAANVVRRVSAKVGFTDKLTSSPNNAVWNYMYSDSLTTCMTMNNSAKIQVPLYVHGNLCLNNSASFTGAQLEVGGKLTLQNSSHVGDPNNLVTHDVHIGGGCSVSGSAYHSPCTNSDHVYAQTAPDAVTPGFTKPPVDVAGWYSDAQPGPKQPCTSGNFPGGFDTDSIMNGSRGNVDLVPGTAYDCQVRDSGGNLVGRIAWAPDGGPNGTGLLTVAGTIFVDGNILFSQQNHAVVSGKGTIYASGTVTLDNFTTVCGVAACDGTWNPATTMLALVAGSSTVANGVSINNHSTFQGALYAVNDYTADNNTDVWGPVIARQIYVNNSTVNHYVPIGSLLTGMPASYSTASTLQNEPGSWGG